MSKKECIFEIARICFEAASIRRDFSDLFGLSEFLTTVAILIVAYGISDERYKFRIEVSKIPIRIVFLVLISVIGSLIVLTKLWFSSGLPIPSIFNNIEYFQSIYALIFVFILTYWIYVSFVSPPRFSNSNALRFSRRSFRVISEGSESQIIALAHEIGDSASNIIECANKRVRVYDAKEGGFTSVIPPQAQVASELLLLLGSRRFCRLVADQAPSVAVEIFHWASEIGFRQLPLRPFSHNVADEMFLNIDSVIHHEDEGYWSGLIGYVKPLSREMFGHADLVEYLAENGGSPLDGMWLSTDKWSIRSWQSYKNSTLFFLKEYLGSHRIGRHSYAVAQILGTYEGACVDSYKINEMTASYYDSIEYKKIEITIDFINRSIDLLQKLKIFAPYNQSEGAEKDIYQQLADCAFTVAVNVSSIDSPDFRNWQIQHNLFWSSLMRGFDGSEARKIFRSRLQRMILSEIRLMDRFYNYKGAKILGLCLNVMGLRLDEGAHMPPEYRALKKLILEWTRKNFLRMYDDLPAVAESCLSGTISFDKENNRLIKTYRGGLSREPAREYLELEVPT